MAQQHRPKILISGSGIAGSVLAFWLLRAYSHANITIVERAPSLRLTGASIDIRNSAIDIVKLMGLEDEIKKHTTQERGVHCVDKHGNVAWTLNASGREDVQSVTSEYEIFRGKLAAIFLDPIKEKVNFVFGETVKSFVQRDDRVCVEFSNGKEEGAYDLLVAADGIGSRIRGQMLSTLSSDQIRDEGCYASYFTIQSDLLHGERMARWYNGTNGRVVFLRPDPDPRGRTRAYLVNVTPDGETVLSQRLKDAMEQGNEAYKDLMEELFKDAGWISEDVIKGMRGSDDFYCSIFAQARSPRLCDGRVVLLGDAGYATPGIGTSLAIIGGYVLAGEILRHDCDVRPALEAYEGLMQPFVQAQQRSTNMMRYLNPQTKWGVSIRNTFMKVASFLMIDYLAMVGAAWLGFTEKKLVMPQYEWPAASL
jgi:2-polyprenyl-6-methoxyphenol hydroxylase-like FAD-dependent oxidoreductase